MENARGEADYLDAQELKVLFANTPIRLAVLNACLTARGALPESEAQSEQAYLGVAPALVDADWLKANLDAPNLVVLDADVAKATKTELWLFDKECMTKIFF